MSTLRNWEFLNASIDQGHAVRDRARELSGEKSKVNRRGKKYQRCPTCGGMVLLPCLLCNPKQFEAIPDFKRLEDYNVAR